MKKTRAIGVTSAVLLASVGLAVPSSAQPPERSHERVQEELLDEDVCGINVDVLVNAVFTDRVFFDADGNFVRFHSTASGTNTFTNDAGEAVVARFANLYVETESIDEEAGTITVVGTNKGLPQLLKTPSGRVLVRDAGLITFVNTYDLETEELLSGEVLISHGPHPEADSDFTLFCEIMSDALG